MMKRQKRSAPRKRRKDESEAQDERAEEYRAVIKPDPFLEEVGEANARIKNPDDRGRVLPSRPCN